MKNNSKKPKKDDGFNIEAFLNVEPRELAPEEMRKIFPALDQPGMQAPTLKPRVAEAILQELAKKRAAK